MGSPKFRRSGVLAGLEFLVCGFEELQDLVGGLSGLEGGEVWVEGHELGGGIDGVEDVFRGYAVKILHLGTENEQARLGCLHQDLCVLKIGDGEGAVAGVAEDLAQERADIG